MNSANQFHKCGNDREKSKYEAPANASNSNRGQPAYKRLVLSLNPFQAFEMEEHFTPLRLPINEVFNAINDQLWVKRLKTI